MHEPRRRRAVRDARACASHRLDRAAVRHLTLGSFLSQGEEVENTHARLTEQRRKKQHGSRADTSWRTVGPRLTSCFFWPRYKRFPPAPASKSGGYVEAGGDRTHRAERSETDMSATTDSANTPGEQHSPGQRTESPVPIGPTCTCLGCHDPATKAIDHPDHGRRVVCDDHAEGHEVIERV